MPRRPLARHSLSTRLLVLTIFFVLLAEVLIYVPSIARFQTAALRERLADGWLVARAEQGDDAGRVSTHALLAQANIARVRVTTPDGEMADLARAAVPLPRRHQDLDDAAIGTRIAGAFTTLIGDPPGTYMRVTGMAPGRPNTRVTVDLAVAPLRAAMLDYSQRILVLSLVISGVTAALVYVSLSRLIVRPMRRIAGSMQRFREVPAHPDAVIAPTDRADEIGEMERDLAGMQRDLAATLTQRERLAALGTAVTRINHDLKNMLGTARLVSDHLSTSRDPTVARMASRLVGTLDRAVTLCVNTLSYAREGPSAPRRTDVPLADLLAEVAADLPERVSVVNEAGAGLVVRADRAQLHRALANLAHNAVDAGADRVRVHADAGADAITIAVADNGPGLPPTLGEAVFEPFHTTGQSGHGGLGLTIARDILKAHGGRIAVAETSGAGTVFHVVLPAARGRRQAA